MDISPLSSISATQLAQRATQAGRAVAPNGEAGFAGALRGALQSVSATQAQSTEMQKQVQLENPNVSLEETMVAMQKSQVGFQATLHVRNRMVQAYTDIMNMTV